MSAPAWAAVACCGLVVVVLLVIVAGMARFRRLAQQSGSFICGLREPGEDNLRMGVCRYGVSELSWWRGRSLAVGPARRWRRSELVIVAHQPLEAALRTDVLGVSCRYGTVSFELSVSEGTYAGLASWVESSPPQGRGLVV